MKVPPFNLSRARDRIAPALRERWDRLLAATAFVGGEEVAEFERAFSAYTGVAGTVGVANGTDALVVALRALGLSPGDEVIVPDFTFVATASAVMLAGGRPVFADVEESTLNLDPRSAADRIGERTVGVVGVHLFGRPFDVEGLGSLCRKNGLWLLEDAAQAHGAARNGRPVGAFGDLATWSFYPSKNLGAFGDAGAVTGDDADLLERVRRIANHGRSTHLYFSELGTNSRLDALQAAVLNCRLELLEEDNQRRRELADRYRGALDGVGDLIFLHDRPEDRAVHHQLTVRTARRDALREHLASKGIGTGIFYPHPLHQQPAFAALEPGEVDLPVTAAACAQVLSLPMFAELTDAEVDEATAAVSSFFS